MQPHELHVRVADSFLQRARGLLLRPPLTPAESLLITPCASVHTFFMRYTIDVVFLDRLGRVLRVVEGLAPWRVCAQPGAFAVLELQVGSAARWDICAGRQLEALQRYLKPRSWRHYVQKVLREQSDEH